MEVGSPGSTSRRIMSSGISCKARLTPTHAAALNDLSSLPPMSKTMPTRFLPPASSALPKTRLQPEATSSTLSRLASKTFFIHALRNSTSLMVGNFVEVSRVVQLVLFAIMNGEPCAAALALAVQIIAPQRGRAEFAPLVQCIEVDL